MIIAKEYDNIDWEKVYKKLALLQYEILEAYKNCKNNRNEILKRQERLVRSFAARAAAVRKVTSNEGKNTAGIDKVIYKTKKEKMTFIRELKNLSNYQAKATRRVYIAKKGTKKRRPLGIPTMFDRGVQTLYYFALVPIAEEQADSRNYGFRLFKSVHDIVVYLKLVLGNYTASRRYILDADIENFFSTVNHQWLLDNIIINKKILKQFLLAGFVDRNTFYHTKEGFPQGSPISPTLANMVLDGLQELCYENNCLFARYADDFYVPGKSEEELKALIPKIAEFLAKRGLQLSNSKTKITNITEGFDALGYHFREYPDKTRIKGTKQGIFLVKPAKENMVRFRRDLSKLIREHRKAPMFTLVKKLNEKQRGWSEYYRTVTAQKSFSSISYHLWQSLWRLIRKRHRRRPARYLYQKYFTKREGNKWIFRCTDSRGKGEFTLFQIAYVAIKRHKLCIDLNPLDPENYQYYEKRRTVGSRHSILLGRERSLLLKKQKGVCPVCEMSLLNDEKVEVHHVLSKKDGGTDKQRNLRLLHYDCHKQVTTSKDIQQRATWLSKKIIS
jgi:RNA-directed DNA polymerase